MRPSQLADNSATAQLCHHIPCFRHRHRRTDIPIYNVANACATGSNALFLARQFVQGGLNECCLAVGVEKMTPGALGGNMVAGAPTPMDLHFPVMMQKYEYSMKAPPMPQMFGNAGREHMEK